MRLALSGINVTGFPVYQEIVLRNVRTMGGARLLLCGPDGGHGIKAQFDGVQVDGLDHVKQQAEHAHITLGPGPSNWNPKADDVKVTGSPQNHTPALCESKFVEFPKL